VLIAHGAEIDESNDDITPLLIAVQDGHKSRAVGITPLFMAAQDGHLEIVKVLI
jgi:ankyrin repeat protein